MNNDAKDLIGRLRAVNLILVLLQVDRFEFPLDHAIHGILVRYRMRFHQMLQLVSDLTNFRDFQEDLLSAVDDILEPASNGYYTRDNLDTLLSLYQGSKDIVHPNYADPVLLRSLLTEACQSKIHDLLHSIMWLRIAFYSCYPDVVLPSLNQDWKAFCSVAIDVGRLSFGKESSSVFVSSLRSWRFSELVVAALEKCQAGGMPHDGAFSEAIKEVEDVLEVA